MEKQLHEAEKHREKTNKDMGNIRQDIDTQKVMQSFMCFCFVVAYAYYSRNTLKCRHAKKKSSKEMQMSAFLIIFTPRARKLLCKQGLFVQNVQKEKTFNGVKEANE